MTKKGLAELGVKESELEELNDKWIAIQIRQERTQDMKILTNDNGTVIADKNLIEVQIQVANHYPELSEKNTGGKIISYNHIPKNFKIF